MINVAWRPCEVRRVRPRWVVSNYHHPMSNETATAGEEVNGYITLLPYCARESVSVEAIIGMASPWGAPIVSALQGTNEDGRLWLGIINETPLSWLRVGAPISKQELEFLHLQRLAVDCKCATGSELFDAIIPGSDPPIFTHWEVRGKLGGNSPLSLFRSDGKRSRCFSRLRHGWSLNNGTGLDI